MQRGHRGLGGCFHTRFGYRVLADVEYMVLCILPQDRLLNNWILAISLYKASARFRAGVPDIVRPAKVLGQTRT